MSKGNLDEALNNANVTYKQLVEIANGIVSKCTDSIDNIIKPAQESIERLTNDDIRTLMLKIAMASYAFSEIKEKSAFKAQCAEALRKESYANEFNSAVGSVAAKENTATVNISDEIIVENVYDLVASLLKTKLDEMHRVVDVLKTVLMSRLSEAKLTNVSDMMPD